MPKFAVSVPLKVLSSLSGIGALASIAGSAVVIAGRKAVVVDQRRCIVGDRTEFAGTLIVSVAVGNVAVAIARFR